MCKRTVKYLFYIIGMIALIFIGCFIIKCYLYSSENDPLIRVYYAGGVISGIFALGAFGVAVYANNTQNKTGRLQRFETTFFNMLNLQQQITNDLFFSEKVTEETNDNNYNIIRGRELFRYFWDTIELCPLEGQRLNEEKIELDVGELDENIFLYRSGLKELLTDFGTKEYEYQKVPTYFDHYFRHLYTLIKFVHNTDFLIWEEKYRYTSIVRATLSRYELVWIYYNCLYGPGLKKFKPLVEEYTLLKNLRKDLLALTKENKERWNTKTKSPLIKKEFSGTDYEFCLSSKKDTKGFYVGAFYGKDERSNGYKLIDEWNDFLSE